MKELEKEKAKNEVLQQVEMLNFLRGYIILNY